jgi:DNA polymerase-1
MGLDPIESENLKSQYFGTFPEIKKTMYLVNEHAKNAGYIKYWTGRRRHFPPSESSHKAYNSLLQGGGAECTKLSLIRIWDEVTKRNTDKNCQVVLTIHDSIVLQIKEGYEDMYLPQAQKIMEEIPTTAFSMTFTVGVGEWGK